eukprot:206139-Rhodomonas_salina.3
MAVKEAGYVKAKRCYCQKSSGWRAYYLDCEVNQTLLNLFCCDSTTGIAVEPRDTETGEPSQTAPSGLFQDQLQNDIW